jgi:crotonobetainyl-CoA:carnitine CoA-transferase CaiB-like acyl-CoA transferase
MLSATPLSGTTIVEIGHSVAAPYAGMILGELGATVIKIENPQTGGDYARGWGPPFTGDTATAFNAINRAKRSVALDLALDADRDALRRLILDRADAVIHNFKFGAMERLGLGGEALVAEKPGLVYCNLGAFGADGPDRARPGYDPLIQAASGLMSIQGEPGSDPCRIGISIIDMSAGLWSVIGILAALREAARTGRGGVVDTSLYESALAWMAVPIASYLASGALPRKSGSGTAHIVPYQAFRTGDGFLMVSAGNDALFRRMAAAMGLDALAENARFRTNADRVIHRDALVPLLQARFLEEPSAFWSARLDEAGVPNGPVRTIDEVVSDTQTTALGILQAAPDGGERLIGLPLSFDGHRPPYRRPAPRLGADNAILGTPAER